MEFGTRKLKLSGRLFMLWGSEMNGPQPIVRRILITNSSNIEFVEYRPTERTLLIGFKNEKEYLYQNFDQQTFDQLLVAQSKGSFVARRIRDKFICRRVK